MSKRLQVLLNEVEYSEIQNLATSRHMTLAEWVRQALRDARKNQTGMDAGHKLMALRNAVDWHFPTAEYEQMAAEIESGYMSE